MWYGNLQCRWWLILLWCRCCAGGWVGRAVDYSHLTLGTCLAVCVCVCMSHVWVWVCYFSLACVLHILCLWLTVNVCQCVDVVCVCVSVCISGVCVLHVCTICPLYVTAYSVYWLWECLYLNVHVRVWCLWWGECASWLTIYASVTDLVCVCVHVCLSMVIVRALNVWSVCVCVRACARMSCTNSLTHSVNAPW